MTLRSLSLTGAVTVVCTGCIPQFPPPADTYAIQCDVDYTCSTTISISLDDIIGCYVDDITNQIDCNDMPDALSGDCCDEARLRHAGDASVGTQCEIHVGPDTVSSDNVCCVNVPNGEPLPDSEVEDCCQVDPPDGQRDDVSDTMVDIWRDCPIDREADEICDENSPDLATVTKSEPGDGLCFEAESQVSEAGMTGSVDEVSSSLIVWNANKVLMNTPVSGSMAAPSTQGEHAAIVLHAPTATYGPTTWTTVRAIMNAGFTLDTSTAPATFSLDSTAPDAVFSADGFDAGAHVGLSVAPTLPVQGTMNFGAGIWTLDHTETVDGVTAHLHLEGPLTVVP